MHELLVSAAPAPGTVSAPAAADAAPPATPAVGAPAPAAGAPGAPAPIDVPQYWSRYTLVLDLTRATGSGAILVYPRPGETWPVRVALRVQRGAIGELDVRAEQRMVIPVDAHGTGPVELTLPAGVFRPNTAQMRIDWRPAAEP